VRGVDGQCDTKVLVTTWDGIDNEAAVGNRLLGEQARLNEVRHDGVHGKS
jgi:hypothetical protein